jgi:ATP-dependent Clp protease ATP-binding subunit ClpA
MWQRFTEQARKVVFYAQEEAQNVGEGYVSTEHLLLAIARNSECVGAKILERLGINLTRLRNEVVKLLPTENSPRKSDMTLTPRAKRVIDLAYDEARNLNNNYIGTEHLLLGLIREGDGVAGRVLAQFRVKLEGARKAVIALQDEHSGSIEQRPVVQQRDIPSSNKAWLVLAARKQRMMADQLCLMFLYEADSAAAKAIEGCEGNPVLATSFVEEEVLAVKTPEELAKGFPTTSDLLRLAIVEAKQLGQELSGVHFLLAALTHGDTATSRALDELGITHQRLQKWVADNPEVTEIPS